jgi:hypothetical protein
MTKMPQQDPRTVSGKRLGIHHPRSESDNERPFVIGCISSTETLLAE